MTANNTHPIDDAAGDALAAVMPFGNIVGKFLSRHLRAEWNRNTSVAVHAAERASGLSREDFAEWINKDSKAAPLFMKVLWVAGMNGHDETLKAIGAVLGRAAKTDNKDEFADAELALHAMSDLGPRHFTVLAALAGGVVVYDENGGENVNQFTPSHIAAVTGLRVSVVHQCLVNLSGAGLVEPVAALGGMAYPVTPLGKAVLHASQEATTPRT